MRFITCSSYYGTGSSAITDFVSEFSNVFDFSTEEFRFIQDPDGISDLEFNLVECFNRHNSGHAVKRYKRLVDFYSGNALSPKYSYYFGEKWRDYSYRYIDELTDFTYPGWWMYDLYDKGNWYYFKKRIMNKILHVTFWRNKPERQLNTLKKEITYCAHPSEKKFLEATRKYIYDLFCSVVPADKDTIMVDQLLPPMNIKRYLRYFDNNIQVIVVDRDPRDVFCLDKYVWKDGMLPNDAETFCQWYEYTRSHRKEESLDTDQVHFIQFEDLVYRYDKVSKEVTDWLALKEENHALPFTRFNPSISINNTQVWKNIPESINEIKIIEHKLAEYLYKFE